MRIVFKIGGSIICPDGAPDIAYVRKLSKFLINLKRKNKIIVVVGGGKMTKDYIRSTRALKPSESLLDAMGILGARMNAMVVIASLGRHAYDKVVRNREDLEHGISTGKIVVMGGTVPGQTTNAVAVAAAQLSRSDVLIIGTNVKGIYDKDPKKFRNAKMIPKMKTKQLYELVRVKKHVAGPMTVMDPVAARLLERSKIRTVLLDGRNIANLKKAIERKNFVGTVIEQ
jgi:uridylate kinase